MKYQNTVSITNTAGNSSGIYVYRGNSIFDPDYSVGGHQPMGASQMVLMYRSYVVVGSKIQIKVANLQANNRTCTFGVIPTLDVYSPASARSHQAFEQPWMKQTMLGPVLSTIGSGKVSHYMSTSKVFDEKPAGVQIAPGYSGFTGGNLVGSNPANQWFWNIIAQDSFINQNAGSVLITAQVVVTYYVKFSDRQAVLASGSGITEGSESTSTTAGTGPVGDIGA